MTELTVAAIQLAFGDDIDANIAKVEARVREAAATQPDTPVHLDPATAENVEFNGSISDALAQIDEEHAATLDDRQLFSVAANCFLSLGQ